MSSHCELCGNHPPLNILGMCFRCIDDARHRAETKLATLRGTLEDSIPGCEARDEGGWTHHTVARGCYACRCIKEAVTKERANQLAILNGNGADALADTSTPSATPGQGEGEDDE